MKKLFVLLSAIAAVYACSNQQKETLSADSSDLWTKSGVNKDYQLAEQDLQNYVHYLSVHNDFKDNAVQSIKPYDKNGEAVFYIINMEKGWRIISSDKRGPIVLAKSKEGQFDIEQTCEEERSWFESIANQIIYRKEHPDKYYSELSEKDIDNEQKCLDFWCAVNGDSLFLQDVINGKHTTRLGGSPILINTYENVISYESVDHLIPVYWDQYGPFNAYCPSASATDTTRCPAGCAAVAVAQMLYYLHYYLSWPPNSPTTGSCTGYVGNYIQTFSNFANYTWNGMSVSNDPNGYAALLIGYLGKELRINYNPLGSGTSFTKVYYIFGSHFGLNCNYGCYNEDVAFSNLQSGLPVICKGENLSTGKEHAFILDGYESCISETHYVYLLPSGQIAQSIVLSDPYLTEFRINWGRGTLGRSSYYAVSGTWMGYDEYKKMVYGFQPEFK